MWTPDQAQTSYLVVQTTGDFARHTGCGGWPEASRCQTLPSSNRIRIHPANRQRPRRARRSYIWLVGAVTSARRATLSPVSVTRFSRSPFWVRRLERPHNGHGNPGWYLQVPVRLIHRAEAPLANAAATAPITSGKYLIGSLHRWKVDSSCCVIAGWRACGRYLWLGASRLLAVPMMQSDQPEAGGGLLRHKILTLVIVPGLLDRDVGEKRSDKAGCQKLVPKSWFPSNGSYAQPVPIALFVRSQPQILVALPASARAAAMRPPWQLIAAKAYGAAHQRREDKRGKRT